MTNDKLKVIEPNSERSEITREQFETFVKKDDFFKRVYFEVLSGFNAPNRFSYHTAFSCNPKDYQFIGFNHNEFTNPKFNCVYAFTRLMYSGEEVLALDGFTQEDREENAREDMIKHGRQRRIRLSNTFEGRSKSEGRTDVLVGICLARDDGADIKEVVNHASITCASDGCPTSFDPRLIGFGSLYWSLGNADDLRITKKKYKRVEAEVVLNGDVPDSIEGYIPRSILLDRYPHILREFKIHQGKVYSRNSDGRHPVPVLRLGQSWAPGFPGL